MSIAVVKFLQAKFINEDIEMYHEESDKKANARTSNLNEDLGMVGTILSDKTGTLTCNTMEFIRCSIGGTSYGQDVTEFENNGDKEVIKVEDSPHVKGFNFNDPRIMNGNWIHEPNRDMIRDFFRLLAICHTCTAEVDARGEVLYKAESPDEAAFVTAAQELGFEFYERSLTSIVVRELDRAQNVAEPRLRNYELLNTLEFTSSRKRMFVIVKEPEGRILLLSKGADSVILKRLAPTGTKFEGETRRHINKYATSGLRTMVLAYRVLDDNEYREFNKEFKEAQKSMSPDRDKKIEEAADRIERDLLLLGATAVEDKLQIGVPECIDKLAQAGVKIWVLTGDKMETSISTGFACRLLRDAMIQIIITLEQPDIFTLDRKEDKQQIAKALKQRVIDQIEDGIKQISSLNQRSTESFALIIDGKSLTYALEDDVKSKLSDLAVKCASVICCRSTSMQKVLVTRMVKQVTDKVTLAIGDGANDVGMLQEADIGVGISGAEGMQAVMASDVAIHQFRFLERLLLVHGHFSYRRNASMICYFFYKNITFGLTIFLWDASL
ncbi:unnamed protein product [Urochloa humidicola]